MARKGDLVMTSKAPKTFISYSWTSASHAEWVLRLATELRENGVDVVLDKWDLKEGNDAVQFMEQMVTDRDIEKVVVVLDSGYVHKADKREGGVGTETQIISAEVYNKTDQTKFVAVLSERDAEGRPYLPIFLKSRIWIDLSDPNEYAQNFEQLLRWIYGKPLNVKPDIGTPPEFLKDSAVHLATHSRARRAIDQLRNATPSAGGSLEEYFDMLANEFERLRIVRNNDEPFDEQVVRSIDSFLPPRNEYVDVVLALSRYWTISADSRLHGFVEKLTPYLFRPPTVSTWTDEDFDNFKFLIHELFLYTIAALIKFGRFGAIKYLLTHRYYLGAVAPNTSDPLDDYTVFRSAVRSLQRRNDRLKLNRMSLQADLLEQRANLLTITFDELMQADFLLFLRSSADVLKTKDGAQWFPVSLVYAERRHGPYELFARSQSTEYFKTIADLLGVADKAAFEEVLANMGDTNRGAPLFLPRWDWHALDVRTLTGIQNLAKRP